MQGLGGTWRGGVVVVILFSFICPWDGKTVCGLSGTPTCYLTGLYLVLIVTLLEPGGDPRSGAGSPRADSRAFIRDIGIARSVAQLVPQADLGVSPALGHILSQGTSCEMRRDSVLSYGVYLSPKSSPILASFQA